MGTPIEALSLKNSVVDVTFRHGSKSYRFTGIWEILENVKGNTVEIQNIKVFKMGSGKEKEIKYFFFHPILNESVRKIKANMEKIIQKQQLTDK